MRSKRVRRNVTPEYPTHDYLLDHPELLRWVPERWRGNRLILGMLSIAVPLIMARQATAGERKDAKPATVRVAPLFIHGDGRGSFGCVVVNPPVFLSEDEARQVVQDEAMKAGIEFVADELTLKDVMVPVTDQFGFLKEREAQKHDKDRKAAQRSRTQKRDIVLDGHDRKHNIAYEVVSQEDFQEWEKKDHGSWCSVSSYDFKTTAEKLTNGLVNAKGETTVAVFYEPGASAPETAQETEWEVQDKAVRELGEKELREQVRGFLQWLKAQGVI